VVWQVPGDKLEQAVEATGFPLDKVIGDESLGADTKGLPLVYVIAGLLSLPTLAQGLVNVYKDFVYGSTIVDASGKELKISHDPKGSADVVILKGKDGKVTMHEGRRAYDASKWLALLGGTPGSAEKPTAMENKK
jgi:hypothetical protein